MTRLAVVLAVVLSAAALPSLAQPAPKQPLRWWEEAGGWQVLMLQLSVSWGEKGRPACLLMHGYATTRPSSPPGQYRLWGFRSDNHELHVILNSARKEDVAATALTVFVDNYRLGQFPVTLRPPTPRPDVSTAVASVKAAGRLIGLLHAGAMLKIDGGGVPFEAALSPLAAAYFSACRHEMSRLSPYHRTGTSSAAQLSGGPNAPMRGRPAGSYRAGRNSADSVGE